MQKADITFKQVENPSRMCASGHIAPEMFKAEEDKDPEPTRFFQITGNGICAIYCEPCLCIANFFAKQIRKSRV
jgi:hypothetical protein